MDGVDLIVICFYWRRSYVSSNTSCGGREKRVMVRFEQRDMKGG